MLAMTWLAPSASAATEISVGIGVQSVPIGYVADGAAIRSAPSLGATVRGRGYRWHSAIADCFTYGTPVNGNPIWVFHVNKTTGVSGWTSTTLMGDYQNLTPCTMTLGASVELPGAAALVGTGTPVG